MALVQHPPMPLGEPITIFGIGDVLVTAPSGKSTVLTANARNRATFTPDEVGDWRVEWVDDLPPFTIEVYAGAPEGTGPVSRG
jgi:hypothetical protein